MLWLKKNSYKEFDNEKRFLRLENSPPPPPPYNVSNGPSLIALELITRLAPGVGTSGNLRDHVTHSHPLFLNLCFVQAPE